MKNPKIKIVYDGLEKGNIYEFVQKLSEFKSEKIQDFKNENENLFLITKTVKYGEITDTTENF